MDEESGFVLFGRSQCVARDMDDLSDMLWTTAHDDYGEYLLWFIFTTVMTTLFRLLVLL
eukprot:COSAG06_NODE_21980_length_738_cov_2.540024_2_plen_58_part_01